MTARVWRTLRDDKDGLSWRVTVRQDDLVRVYRFRTETSAIAKAEEIHAAALGLES